MEEFMKRRVEVGGQKSEVRKRQRTEVGGQMSGDRRQRTEKDGDQRTDVRGINYIPYFRRLQWTA
jgi:hypothetical protein